MKTGERLRKARGIRTMEQVAKDLKISKSSLSMYENNHRIPRDRVKEKLAQYYGTTVGFLFFEEKVQRK